VADNVSVEICENDVPNGFDEDNVLDEFFEDSLFVDDELEF